MTLWIIIGAAIAIAFLVAGQKAANAKRERDHAASLAEAAAKLAAEKAKADAQAEYDAIVGPRRERWGAWENEVARLTLAARDNPPIDLHRIVWEPETHRYKVMRWWLKTALEIQDLITAEQLYRESPTRDRPIERTELDTILTLRVEALGRDRRYFSIYDLPYCDRREPPSEAKALCGYEEVTAHRFESVKAAEYWLFLELHPDENQRGYDMDGRHVTDEVVPLERPTIPGLPSLVLGSASAVVDDSDVDLTLDDQDVDVFVGGRFIPSRAQNRPSSRYRKLT